MNFEWTFSKCQVYDLYKMYADLYPFKNKDTCSQLNWNLSLFYLSEFFQNVYQSFIWISI